jgi:hypothetical protein
MQTVQPLGGKCQYLAKQHMHLPFNPAFHLLEFILKTYPKKYENTFIKGFSLQAVYNCEIF